MPHSVSLPNENDLKQQLSQSNLHLCPSRLVKVFPKYDQYTRNLDHFGVWQNSTIISKIKKHRQRYKKVLLLLSGVAGGGKDAIREKITQLYPRSIFKIITATSRPPRKGEQHARDYYFYDSKEEFKKAIDNNQLLEWVSQGSRLYGLPKISLADAMVRPEPIIVTHVEMTAWPKVTQFIREEVADVDKPFVLKVFVMPRMKYNRYAHDWLATQRADYDSRMSRTLWELSQAPQNADLIISNHIDKYTPFLIWQTQALTRIIRQLLTAETDDQFSA